MTMPFYSSVDQLLRDRSELARKGISRGRSVVVLTYAGGVLFVAENRSTALHKVSEIYDKIGFAAVGRYNEFENLRTGGIRMADFRGFTYDRRDVTGRMLANAYAQALGTAFVEQQKPFEVELCVAEVGVEASGDQLYRITYDGSITDEPRFVVMGGQTEPISQKLSETYAHGLELGAAIEVALGGLQVPGRTRRRPATARTRSRGSWAPRRSRSRCSTGPARGGPSVVSRGGAGGPAAGREPRHRGAGARRGGRGRQPGRRRGAGWGRGVLTRFSATTASEAVVHGLGDDVWRVLTDPAVLPTFDAAAQPDRGRPRAGRRRRRLRAVALAHGAESRCSGWASSRCSPSG